MLFIFLLIGENSYPLNFGADPLWDDGLAEVAVYRSKKYIYGTLWDHETTLITVKEDFTKKYYTKADYPYAGKPLIPVLKLNIFTRIQTTNYPYHYLVSVFVKKNDLAYLLKMTVSSQEWCGNTFKEWQNWNTPARIVYHSYFDGQGNGTIDVPYKQGDLLTEQLFVSLRGLPFANGYSQTFRLLDPMMSNTYKKPRWRNATLTVSGPEPVQALRKNISCWIVHITHGSGEFNFWFDTEYPHPLIKYDDADGQEMIITNITRRAYWKR